MGKNKRTSSSNSDENTPKPPLKQQITTAITEADQGAGKTPTCSVSCVMATGPPDHTSVNTASMSSMSEDVELALSAMKNIQCSLRDYTQKQKELEDHIHGEDGIDCTIANIQENLSENVFEVTAINNQKKNTDKLIASLCAIVIKQQRHIDSMLIEIDDLKGRSMRDNIIIHNITEKGNNEDLVRIVLEELSSNGYDMQDIEFDRIHRSGFPSKKPRLIIAKPHRAAHIRKLLTTKPRDRNKAWVSPQHTEKVREIRRQLGEMATTVKTSHPGADVRIKSTNLYVNNQRINPPLSTPSPTVILQQTPDELEVMRQITFSQPVIKSESGSIFTACAARCQTLNDVRQAYKALLTVPDKLSASHNIAGYVLPDGSSGYADDKDYGMGRVVAQALQQSGDKAKGWVVFLTRQYGGQKLGYKRFEIARDITQSVLSKI